MIIRTIARLLALLNSNARPGEVGAAIAFGLWLALVPGGNLVFFALALALFLARVNLGMGIASLLLFSLLVPLADPLVDGLGYAVLTVPRLEPAFTAIAPSPFAQLARFNDTLVAGGLVAGAALFVPVTLLGAVLVRVYRRSIHPRIVNSKLVKAIMATPFAQKVSAAVDRVRRVWPATE